MRRTILIFFLAICWAGGRAWAQDIGVKTNILYWATSTPNLGFEFGHWQTHHARPCGWLQSLDARPGGEPEDPALDGDAGVPLLVMRAFQRPFLRGAFGLCLLQPERGSHSVPGQVHQRPSLSGLGDRPGPLLWVITGYLANGGTSRRRWASVTSNTNYE